MLWDDYPPLTRMTDAELADCLKHTRWLIEHERLLPRGLAQKLDTWHADLLNETERRAQTSRTRR
jgi:hypothetical protein